MSSVTAGGPTSKRRRFQGPITNYFPVSTPDTGGASSLASNSNYRPAENSLNLALPTKVQSSLLSVGMRVRKAVPEGYKTTESTTKLDPYTYRAICHPSDFSTHSDPAKAATELAPLCGMSKVGNLGVQTVNNELGFEARWDHGFISSNQEPVDPTSSLPAPNPGKRVLEADLDEDNEDTSPRLDFSRTADDSYPLQTRYPTRKILTPKIVQQRRLMAFRPAKWDESPCGGPGCDQENQNPLPPAPADFEDAVFLRRREEVDDDFNGLMTEVEMGGV